jgi:hypothetical protein
MDDSNAHVRAAVGAALARRHGAGAASTASMLHEVRASVASQIPDEAIVAMLVDAAPHYDLSLVFDHRQIDL